MMELVACVGCINNEEVGALWERKCSRRTRAQYHVFYTGTVNLKFSYITNIFPAFLFSAQLLELFRRSLYTIVASFSHLSDWMSVNNFLMSVLNWVGGRYVT